MDAAVEPWLVSLGEVRQALTGTVVGEGLFRKGLDLGALAPSEVHPLAAVLLVGRALVRERWTLDTDLSERALDALDRAVPEPVDFVERSFRQRGQVLSGPSRCTNCPAKAGFGACVKCSGTGELGGEMLCGACIGGFAPCTLCDGTAVTVRASVEYLRDVMAPLGRVFLPRLPGGLKSALARVFDPGALPEALRLRLERTRLESAYRGASRGRAPEFHGHAFGEAFEEALGAQDDLREAPGVRLWETHAWAWPFVWLRYDARGAWWDVVAFRDRHGDLRTTMASGVG